MADSEPSAASQQRATPAPPPPSEEQAGETHLSLAVKSIFWLILLPVGVLLLIRWLLQSSLLQP